MLTLPHQDSAAACHLRGNILGTQRGEPMAKFLPFHENPTFTAQAQCLLPGRKPASSRRQKLQDSEGKTQTSRYLRDPPGRSLLTLTEALLLPNWLSPISRSRLCKPYALRLPTPPKQNTACTLSNDLVHRMPTLIKGSSHLP